ncbi:MAG: TRAP transporter small permease subunit [Jannaschia sp.]
MSDASPPRGLTAGAGRIARGISDALDRAAEAGAILALVVLVGAVTVQVVARYVLFSPPTWTEELARYAMIWAGLLGATLSFKRRFDPALFGAGAAGTSRAIIAGFLQSAVVLIYLTPILWHAFFGPDANPARGFLTRHSRTSAESMEFTTLWVAIAVPIMIVLILVHLIARWFRDVPPPRAEGEIA